MSSKKLTRRSLKAYVRLKKNSACPVCKLPGALKKQIRQRHRGEIKMEDVRTWLRDEHGFDISRSHFFTHYNGKHGWED